MGRRQYAKLLAPWVAVAWLLAWSALLMQPCCEAFAAPVHEHAHGSVHMHDGQHDHENESAPAPCDHLLSADLDSSLLTNEVSIGSQGPGSPSLGVAPPYSMQFPLDAPDAEGRLTFRADFSPPNPSAIFLTTQRFRI